MAQKPEDFNLPMSAIKKILKDSIPSGVHVTEGARLALSKAASVFVLYATTGANGFTQDNNRKRVLGKDVIDALNDIDLGFLVPNLHNALAEYKKCMASKKQAKGRVGREEDDEEEEMDKNIEVEVVQEEIIILSSDSDEAEVTVANSDANSSSEEEDD